MTQQTCETCRWWGNAKGNAPGDIPYADCRRHAPSVAAYHPGGYTDQLDWVTEWPRTSAETSCGEHQPRTQEQKE